jgi:purine-binding chemotaxis protein CheW
MIDAVQTATGTRSDYCTFRLGGRLFGFDILAVKEVNTHTKFTPVPHAPAAVRGYVNLRGDIALVVDLRQLLGLEPLEVSADTRLIMFKASAGDSLGVLVDEIGSIARVEADAIEAWRADEQPGVDEAAEVWQAGELVTGVGKLEGELLIILEPRKLVKAVAELMHG